MAMLNNQRVTNTQDGLSIVFFGLDLPQLGPVVAQGGK